MSQRPSLVVYSSDFVKNGQTKVTDCCGQRSVYTIDDHIPWFGVYAVLREQQLPEEITGWRLQKTWA